MRVSVLDGSAVVGTAILDRLDPPMGVAWGVFVPSAEYDRERHARMIEGEWVPDLSTRLSVRPEGQSPLSRVRVDIEDYTGLFGEKQLWVYFESGTDYDPLFSEYDDYRTYYRTGR
jgi:hypothetical protein